MIKLVVGVGNPGIEYELTRHNIAWLCIDQFSNLATWQKKFKGEFSSLNLSEKIYFLKPHTYMNLSGESVIAIMNFFKITLDEILVIHDEVDLPFGTISFKNGGGYAGHNGLKSIGALCGGDKFKRLRIGVGRPTKGSMSSWVLSRFKEDETIELEKTLIGSFNAVEDALKTKDFSRIQNKYNKKNFLEI